MQTDTHIEVISPYHCYDCSRHTGMTFYHCESPCQTRVNPMLLTSLLHCSICCTQRITLDLLSYLVIKLGKLFTPMSPSSSSIIWCNSWEGNDRLWKRCGLPSTTLDLKTHSCSRHWNGDECLQSSEGTSNQV